MIGTQIDNFRIVEKIGDGGMGSVYRAVDVVLERDLALKFLKPELAREPELIERFRAEAVVLARLNHSHIAALYGLHRYGDELFMAMEYVPGETVEAMLARVGRLSAHRAVEIAAAVLDALDYAHRRGVVHRDIKTANLIVTPEGSVKVMDFGIARVLGTARRTRVGYVVGTLGYMAPEQIQGAEVDGRTDVYALGIVLYEMLAGRVPFVADTEWALMQAQVHDTPPPPHEFADVAPPIEAAVLRALAKAPVDRFQTAVEFKTAILRGSDPSLAALPATRLAPPPSGGAFAGRAREAVASTRLAGGTPPVPPTRLASPAFVSSDHVAAAHRLPWLTGLRGWRVYAAAAAVAVTLAGVLVLVTRVLSPSAPAPPVVPSVEAGPSGEVAVLSEGGGPVPRVADEQEPVGEPRRREPPVAASEAPATPPTYRVTVPRSEPAVTGRPAPPVRAGEPKRPAASGAVPPAPLAAPPSAPAPPVAAAAPAELPAAEPAAPPPSESLPSTAVATVDRFDKVKFLRQDGDKSREVEAILELGADSLVVRNKEAGGGVVKTLHYRAITYATYSQSKHPRWKEGVGAAIAVGVFAAPVFFMKGTKHWLTVQSAEDFVVIRLDKNNYRLILPALETRSGKAVERAAGDK